MTLRVNWVKWRALGDPGAASLAPARGANELSHVQVTGISTLGGEAPSARDMHFAHAMNRVHRLTVQGKPVLHIDLSNLKPGEFKPVFAEAMSILSPAPLGSARVVTDVEGARFDPATIVEFEAFVREATPRCLANAIVGVSGIRRVAWLGLKPFYKCPAELSDSLEKGKSWVAAYGA